MPKPKKNFKEIEIPNEAELRSVLMGRMRLEGRSVEHSKQTVDMAIALMKLVELGCLRGLYDKDKK